MTLVANAPKPGWVKRSRAKIWIRTGLLTIFGTLFGLQLYNNITAGYFQWTWTAVLLLAFLPIGFLMRQLVPMQIHTDHQVITLTLDKVYFVTIWVLVIAKYVAFYAFQAIPVSDVIMCVILGLMAGRLSGICLRVSQLKTQYGFHLSRE